MSRSHQNLTRRDFIRLGAVGAAAAGLGGLGAAQPMPAGPLGKLPLRRYGRTGLQISAIVGASDWNASVIPMAVEAGVNYWHKAQDWDSAGMPEALQRLPRETYYLECVVDRVGGHERGRIDEEAHYQFVKQCAQQSGARYFDVMKFHFGYHSINEAKADTGVLRAFRRLRKEGLVHHLAISQHDYTHLHGDKDHDILAYVFERLPYEAAQLFYTYGDAPVVAQMIALAKRQDIGTIAMKTMRGVGRASKDPKLAGLKPGQAMVRWLMSNADLTAAVIAIRNFTQLRENLSGAAQSALQPRDRETLCLLAAHNKGLTCLLCAECVSRCPERIAIADILRCERYACDYDDLARARAEYSALTRNGTACAGCGACLPTCPEGIDIAGKMRDVHGVLG